MESGSGTVGYCLARLIPRCWLQDSVEEKATRQIGYLPSTISPSSELEDESRSFRTAGAAVCDTSLPDVALGCESAMTLAR